MYQPRLRATDVVQFGLGHAHRSLPIVDGRAVKIADPQALAFFDPAPRQDLNPGPVMVPAKITFRVRYRSIIPSFFVDGFFCFAPHRYRSSGPSEDVDQRDLLEFQV